MSELLRTILIMSISGSIIALLLFALKPLVRNRLPKSVQYYLWLVVLVALLVPFSRFIILPQSPVSAPGILPAAPISQTVERYAITVEESLDILQRDEQFFNQYYDNLPQHYVFPVFTILLVIYPFGVATVLLYTFITFAVFLRKLRRRNEPFEISCKAHVYRNPLAATPMLIGIFRPAIILPDREYTNEQLHAVLLHELTHLRRKDVLVKWLSVVVTALHWFNPIVWLVRREIDRACELSCDEAVTRNLDADGKQSYGETLLYVAADSKMPHVVLSTTMCEEKKALKERLGAIMKNKKHTRLAIIVSAVLLVTVAGVAITLGAGRATPTVNDPAEMSGATQYIETLFAEYTNPIADSRITLFEKTGEFNGITSNNLAVWQLEFDYLPVDPDAFNRVSDVRMESDGWVIESEVSRVFLVFSYDNGTVTYLGAIPRLRHDLYFPLYEQQGQEQALQVFIDELTNPPIQDYKPLRGYLTDFNASDMTFMLKEIGWLTVAEDSDLLIEQGINPDELPNGFYIKEYPNIAPVMFQFNTNTEFRVIDYVEHNGQHKTISTNDFGEFIRERETAGISTLCIIEWDREVISVSEQYLP